MLLFCELKEIVVSLWCFKRYTMFRMKSLIYNACVWMSMTLVVLNATSQEIEVPFLSNDAVSTAHFYYPNQGQIADDGGQLHPEILFHTEMTNPAYFFQDNKLSFVTLKLDSIEPDTNFRIDMEFYHSAPPVLSSNESVVELVALNERSGHFNYYLPHCATGIEGVNGYERLIYKDAYTHIDVEFTSNVAGLKARFVVRPGGNPSDILLKFTGQHGIVEKLNGDLEMFLGNWKMEFKQAYAYQTDSGEATLVNWLPIWNHDGNGIVSIATGAYNSDLPLVIEMGGPAQAVSQASSLPPYWGTYYGGMGMDETKGFDTDLDGNLYTLTNVKGSGATFPAYIGVSYPNNLTFNVLVSKFDGHEALKFATYYGGTMDDNGMALAYHEIPDGVGNIFIGGYTESDNLQYGQGTSAYNQGKQQGIDGLLLKFDAQLGSRKWVSYFGGNGNEFIMDLVATTQELYVCGVTSSTNAGNCTGIASGFPVCNSLGNSYYQPASQGGKEAFVAQLNVNPLSSTSLEWSTFFGGNNADRAYSIAYDFDNVTQTTEIYVAGKTTTSKVESSFGSPLSSNAQGSFPLANPIGGAYFQSVLGATSSTLAADAFIAKFNNQRQLVWSSFFGGDEDDQFSDIAINTNGVTVVGYTESLTENSGNCTANSNGKIPKCSTMPNGYLASNQGMRDVLITQFSTNGVLNWSTCYGGTGQEAHYGLVKCVSDREDNIYVTANSFPLTGSYNMSTYDPGAIYFQYDNQHLSEGGYGSDNVLLMFDEYNSRLWATYFGGGCSGCTTNQGDEFVAALTVFNSEWVYFGGFSRSLSTPRHQSWSGAYFDDQHGSINSNFRENDGYITKLNVHDLALFLNDLTNYGRATYLKGYPNPASSELTIRMPNTESIEVNLVIYNSIGEEVHRLTTHTDGNILKLNINSLTSGWYFIKIKVQDEDPENYVYSFVKQ